MDFASFNVSEPDVLIAAAVHNGHDLRPDLAVLTAVDDATRLREEDPHTGRIAARFANSVVVHRSRFEVDLNRDRHEAVYASPEDSWGLDVWRRNLTEDEVSASLALYDRFYIDLAQVLDRLVAEDGGFVLYDIHSYNHRRLGPDAPPDLVEESPVVNLGTGSLPVKWKPVADAFMESLRSETFDEAHLDVRENVRFEGRHLARWVHENYGDAGCALAIELKKVFMDEWTGELDLDRMSQLGDALIASGPAVRKAWSLA
ncbi:MAG TPA: N-formylglutamate amidohydrolase [Acidimicrobiia bacterium]|jgi:N-formylglutamate amidohydrolase|nr:N-formylglutamate amidohydrolase [Acidimicrobiia bacterium]HYJ23924.1 N-formylglutamate amidohydrolase [Acidimicrobiia bacterium]